MFAARRCPRRQPSAAPWRTTDMATAITRRNIVQTVGASTGIGMLAASVATTIAQQTAAAPSPSPIETTTVKRRGTGLRGHDPDRICRLHAVQPAGGGKQAG